MQFTIVFSVFSFLIGWGNLWSQSGVIGSWNDYLPYNSGKKLAISEKKVFCSTPYGVFSYDLEDYSLERFSKVSGLSDYGVSEIAWHNGLKVLMIGYNSGHLDLLHEDYSITNIQDIKRSNIIGSKKINKIYFKNEYAYLACGFGIVVMNVNSLEISDTWLIGDEGTQLDVRDLVISGDEVFAATEQGVYRASLPSPNLADYNNWNLESQLPFGSYTQMLSFNGVVLTCFDYETEDKDTVYQLLETGWSSVGRMFNRNIVSLEPYNNKLHVATTYNMGVFNTAYVEESNMYTYGNNVTPHPNHFLVRGNNDYWIADEHNGLVNMKNAWSGISFVPKGPANINTWQMDVNDGELWMVTGARAKSNGNNYWYKLGINFRNEGDWKEISYKNTAGMDTIHDLISVVMDPSDDNHVFAGSLANGLVEIREGQIVNVFNSTNSSLQHPDNWFYHGVSGINFDSNNNLWVVQSRVMQALSVKKTDGSWKSFSVPQLANELYIGNMLVTKNDHLWIEFPGNGIVVYDFGNTPDDVDDDQSILLSSGEGSGGLHSVNVLSMAEDQSGEIWVGTGEGIAVFYSPSSVFSGNIDARRILVNFGGYNQYLLETETVTSIAVDGANRKWIGTDGSGVYLLNEDGTEEIYHFTEQNSPLFSNAISNITIDGKTGEVYIGTEKGLLSFLGDATDGELNYNHISAYPNPVRPGYSGPVVISGLVANSQVRISDMGGNLVQSAVANGGTFVWDGNNANGIKVSTGVYMVFCSDESGSLYGKTKILFIN